MSEPNYGAMETIPNLPHWFRPHDGEPVPEELIGATIVNVGTFREKRTVKGGGLVIDYRPSGQPQIKRIVIGSSDIESWVAYLGTLPDSPIPVALTYL